MAAAFAAILSRTGNEGASSAAGGAQAFDDGRGARCRARRREERLPGLGMFALLEQRPAEAGTRVCVARILTEHATVQRLRLWIAATVVDGEREADAGQVVRRIEVERGARALLDLRPLLQRAWAACCLSSR